MPKRLFIISNRLPVNIISNNDSLQVNTSSGGLVTAIDSYLNNNGAGQFSEKYWVGVPGCSNATWSKAAPMIPEGDYKYIPIFINKKTYDGYYNGLSNSVLWPLFHYFPSYAEYNMNYFEHYMDANSDFVNTLLRHLQPGDVVWIHDYHLLPLAGLLRAHIPELTIGFFLHIPFPSYEIFRLLPKQWQKAFLEGMLGADLIGFHTIDYASHFLKCAQMILGLDNDLHVIRFNSRLVKVDVFPISIDYTLFNNAYSDTDVSSSRKELKDRFRDKKIIFSVDRLDYTKGVNNRLKAYDYFLKNHPEYHEKVVFVLVVVPSRDNITKYAERKKMIDEYIGHLNSTVGNINWQPIIYQYNHLDFKELITMYTSCDLALITPLRDGMNLVAKEFVASRKDKRGVLALSEMAGAVRELTDALTINPNDTRELAEKIQEGLEMSEQEQERRMTAMQERIEQYDVRMWAEDFLTELYTAKNKQQEFEIKFFDNEIKHNLFDQYRKSKKRLLLLDYDGTLVPFSPLPDQAKPNADLLQIIDVLSQDKRNDIFIISGRKDATLNSWLGHMPINIISEHGAKFRLSGGDWVSEINFSNEWQGHVKTIMDRYVRRCANSFIETKSFSLAWHYRNSNQQQAKIRAAELFSELSEYTTNMDLHVLMGNKVIEVRHKGVDKGIATQKIINRNDYDMILSIGDDTTDEDMFRVLMGDKRAYTIKVGATASFAKYNLHTSHMVVSLLHALSNIHSATRESAATTEI